MAKYVVRINYAYTVGPKHVKMVGGNKAAFSFEAKDYFQAERIAERIRKSYYDDKNRKKVQPYLPGRDLPRRPGGLMIEFDEKTVHSEVIGVMPAEDFCELYKRTLALPLSPRNIADLVR